jgi:hypothetical protein
MGHATSYWESTCRLSAEGTGLKTGRPQATERARHVVPVRRRRAMRKAAGHYESTDKSARDGPRPLQLPWQAALPNMRISERPGRVQEMRVTGGATERAPV